MTKLEAPFVQLLDQLELPVTVIMADTVLSWVVGVGNRRNIPVASLWTMSPSMLSTTIQRFQADYISGEYIFTVSHKFLFVKFL